MAAPRVLVLVLAGGAGGRLELLTQSRAKPAVPFAGVYRLIDFPLSSCQHSGLADVWVSVQFHPASLAEHLANGRPWDLDRTAGGLMMLPPFRGNEREGWHAGTADSLWRNAPLIRRFRPEALVVLSADAVYRLDYLDLVYRHLDSSAAVTMVTTQVDPDDAGRYGVVRVSGDRVTSYDYKPERPATDVVANEVFVFSPDRVLDRLEDLARDAGEDGLADLGHALLPSLVADGAAQATPLHGYWRDVGTVQSYWQAHQDLVGAEQPLRLDDPAWPVHTRGGRHSAARVLAGAVVDASLISGGTTVAGTVRGSVLSPGVVVGHGAVVTDSVLLPGVHVAAGATVTRAVLDDEVSVGAGASVGGDGELTLVGLGAPVPDGAVIAPGARYPAGEDE